MNSLPWHDLVQLSYVYMIRIMDTCNDVIYTWYKPIDTWYISCQSVHECHIMYTWYYIHEQVHMICIMYLKMHIMLTWCDWLHMNLFSCLHELLFHVNENLDHVFRFIMYTWWVIIFQKGIFFWCTLKLWWAQKPMKD